MTIFLMDSFCAIETTVFFFEKSVLICFTLSGANPLRDGGDSVFLSLRRFEILVYTEDVVLVLRNSTTSLSHETVVFIEDGILVITVV